MRTRPFSAVLCTLAVAAFGHAHSPEGIHRGQAETRTQSVANVPVECKRGHRSPYYTMNDWQFVDTWAPRPYEHYRMADALALSSGYYQRTVRTGTFEARVFVPQSYGRDVSDAVIRQVGMTLANIPSLLTQRLPRLEIRFRHDFSSTAAFYHPELIFDAANIHTPTEGSVFLGSRSSHRNFEELLVHELAHALDWHLGYPSVSTAWQNATLEAPCLVSEYARTNESEHWAESLTAFLLYYAGRDTLRWADRNALHSRLGRAKFRYFGQLLSPGAGVSIPRRALPRLPSGAAAAGGRGWQTAFLRPLRRS